MLVVVLVRSSVNVSAFNAMIGYQKWPKTGTGTKIGQDELLTLLIIDVYRDKFLSKIKAKPVISNYSMCIGINFP